MNRLALAFSVVCVMAITACSSGRLSDPALPQLPATSLPAPQHDMSRPGHSLLGFFRVAIDPDSATVESTPIRAANWHLNAVKFLEPPQSGSFLSFSNVAVAGHLVDVDVTIRHPFPGLPQYAGFDVKGIVIGPADRFDVCDPSRRWAGGPNGLRLLNADGWTRWWNPTEFPYNGTVFSYTNGRLGTPAEQATYDATLCGYKVFASALGKDDPITKLLAYPLNHSNGRAVFHSFGVRTRHYRLVFPGNGLGGPKLVFNYAVDACHAFPPGYTPGGYVEVPDDFPPDANQLEPFILDTNITKNTLYLQSEGCTGGTIVFDIRVSDWQALLSGTPVSSHVQSVELTSPSLFVGRRFPVLTSDSTPEAPWATYHVELSGLTPDSLLDQQILVTVVSAEGSYQPALSSYNGASPLSSHFVVRVPISETGPIQGGFSINPHAPWPKTGRDRHNTNSTVTVGPQNPQLAWEIPGLAYACRPVVDTENRTYVYRNLTNGGVTLIALGSDGLPISEIVLPDFDPGGDPVIAGCSLLWSSSKGKVIRVYPDGGVEKAFEPLPGPVQKVYGLLNMDDSGRAFVYGPSGMIAFNESGSQLWVMKSTKGVVKVLVGQCAVAGDGVIVVGELDIENTSEYSFNVKGVNRLTGDVMWECVPSISHAVGNAFCADPFSSQVYYTLTNHVVAISTDGVERWVYSTVKQLSPTVALWGNGNICAAEVGSGSSSEDDEYKLVALDKHGALLWKFSCTSPIVAGPIVDAENNIYFATRDAEVYSLDPTGSQRWMLSNDGRAAYLTFGPPGCLLLGMLRPQYTTSVICIKNAD